MVVPLRLHERWALAALGAGACASALAMSIDDARGAARSAGFRKPPASTAPPASRGVLPLRDPFQGDPALTSAAAPPARPLPIPSLLVVTPPPLAAFAAGIPAMRVTATVTGAHPFAVLEDSNAARIVTVGDDVGARVVTAIDADGLHLSDGTTLPVAAPGRMRTPLQGDASP